MISIILNASLRLNHNKVVQSLARRVMSSEAFRKEVVTMGEVLVPKDRLFGAQTQRSVNNFKIGQQSDWSGEQMPKPIINAMAILKKACARVNRAQGYLDRPLATAIEKACDEVMADKLESSEVLPLLTTETKSGLQFNDAFNAFIAKRATKILGESLDDRSVDPNDHVNKSQSSNDTFPSVMHIAIAVETNRLLLPALNHLLFALKAKEVEYFSMFDNIFRTLVDVFPNTHPIDHFYTSLSKAIEDGNEAVVFALEKWIYYLAVDGTAVGKGLDTKRDWNSCVAKQVSYITDIPFRPKSKPDACAKQSGAINVLARSLYKIAHIIRLLAIDSSFGTPDLMLPSLESESVVIPGKANTISCDEMLSACNQVLNDFLEGIPGDVKVFTPINGLYSVRHIMVLSHSCESFAKRCIEGIVFEKSVMKTRIKKEISSVLRQKLSIHQINELMDNAFEKGIAIKDSSIELNFLTEEEFNDLFGSYH